MKQTALMRRLAVLVGTVLVAVLALSSLAWAADPLVVTKTVPDGGATGVAPSANIDAYFNQDVAASTVTSRKFKIREKGTTTWLGAIRSINNTISPTSTNGGSESVITINPDADLAPNTIYQVVIVGGTSGVKGVNGEILSTNKKWTFTTANDTPPDTTIDSGPEGTVASDSASFAFSSSKANSTFKCSLDGSTFAACTSPKDYPGPLSQGNHTFRVRAIDASGTQDPTPAKRSWTVDFTIAPVNVTPNPLDFTPGTSVCNVTITKTATITNNTASQVDLFPSVTNAHYSVAGDVLHIAAGESLDLSVSWTAPNWGFRITDPGRLELKDVDGNTIAKGDLTALINCGIIG